MDYPALTAISTIILAIAAIIAILRDEIRSLFRHPEFSANFTSSQPDCHLVPFTWRTESSGGTTEAHYIRCRIENNGKIAARDVEVVAVEIKRKDASNVFRTQRMATPWNLVWAHHKTHVLSQLPRDAERHITLGHVINPRDRHNIPYEDDPSRNLPEGTTLFCLGVFIRSNTLEYLLDPGEYIISLKVEAANARSKKFTFHLNHTGKWFDTEERMYEDGLGLKIE